MSSHVHRVLTIKSLFATMLVCLTTAATGQHNHETTFSTVTTVPFESSCKAEVKRMIERGVGLLHSFWFSEARDTFALVAHSDVDCAVAYWGIALSEWGDPFALDRPSSALDTGYQAILRGDAARQASPRERLYLAAVAELFRNHQTVSQMDRVRAYRRSMATLSAHFPNDVDAQVFSALSRVQVADRTDPTDADRLAAGEMLEALFHRHPEHAGIAHYLLRTFDQPRLAPRALDAARRYRDASPPTAAAMLAPAAVFLQLGLWQEALDVGLASADAARRDDSMLDELRALDVQAYAYLRIGQRQPASSIVDRVVAQTTTPGADRPLTEAGQLLVASMRARNALESGDWTGRSSLPVDHEAPAATALFSFARGVGAARAGLFEEAQQERARILAARRLLQERGEWYGYVGRLEQVLEGWILFKRGQTRSAIALLEQAVNAEERTRLPDELSAPVVSIVEMLEAMRVDAQQPQ